MNDVKTVWDALLDMLFPRTSAVYVFNAIPLERIEQVAIRTFVPLPFPCIAPLPYSRALVRDAVHAAKYHNHERAASLLGQTLAPYLAEEISERQMFGRYDEPYIVAVPLHKSRSKERGYNQAERIAAAIAAHLELKDVHLRPDMLTRVKNTQSQTSCPGKVERRQNMNGAFEVRNTDDVQDKDIVLIDDVVTTGATFSAARDSLLQAGARDVLCVAAAH